MLSYCVAVELVTESPAEIVSFTAAFLLLSCCFPTALLLLYCRFTAALLFALLLLYLYIHAYTSLLGSCADVSRHARRMLPYAAVC
jgi:hypothetical protein